MPIAIAIILMLSSFAIGLKINTQRTKTAQEPPIDLVKR